MIKQILDAISWLGKKLFGGKGGGKKEMNTTINISGKNARNYDHGAVHIETKH